MTWLKRTNENAITVAVTCDFEFTSTYYHKGHIAIFSYGIGFRGPFDLYLGIV